MCKKPAWDELNFVRQHIIVEAAFIRWVHWDQKQIDMGGNDTQVFSSTHLA